MKRLWVSGFLAVLIVAAFAETTQIYDNHVQKTITLQAEDRLNVVGNHNNLTVEGRGGSVTVMGNHNDIHFQGPTESCDVMGNNNNLVIDADMSKLSLTGNSNKIRIIRRKGRNQPKVNQLGNKNDITYDEGK